MGEITEDQKPTGPNFRRGSLVIARHAGKEWSASM
jgi:hypothetical protein